jgi:hypothetical protein
MRLGVVAALIITSSLSACEVRHQVQPDTKQEDSLAQLDSSPVATIEGNDGHNLLAKGDRLERGMALASAVKGVEGKTYCSPERTFYRGRGKTDSFWAIQCHDGMAYQVQIKRDGSGGVVDCTIIDRIDPKNGCWTPLPRR